MDIASRVRDLNKSIEQHYDIIWQEDWYGFYDDAMELASHCVNTMTNRNVVNAALMLASRLEEGGDAPCQETWFDICEVVFDLTLALYMANVVPESLLAEFPGFYEAA